MLLARQCDGYLGLLCAPHVARDTAKMPHTRFARAINIPETLVHVAQIAKQVMQRIYTHTTSWDSCGATQYTHTHTHTPPHPSSRPNHDAPVAAVDAAALGNTTSRAPFASPFATYHIVSFISAFDNILYGQSADTCRRVTHTLRIACIHSLYADAAAAVLHLCNILSALI